MQDTGQPRNVQRTVVVEHIEPLPTCCERRTDDGEPVNVDSRLPEAMKPSVSADVDPKGMSRLAATTDSEQEGRAA